MKKTVAALALASASALVLAGCAQNPATGDGGGGGDAFQIVASTDVYGQIAQEIGGDAVEITAIIDSPTKDPHEYELTAQDQLQVSKADLIIRNGGGYDPFIDSAIETSGVEAPIITAAEFSAEWPGDEEDGDHDHADEDHADEDHAEEEGEHAEGEEHDHIEGFNEHVWYDPDAVEQVASAIADELSDALPDEADAIQSNLDAFTSGVEDVRGSLTAIAEAHGGATVFVTEPVPLYFTAAAGLENVTPEEFSESVEEGQDVPPATMLESLDLLTPGTTDVVIVNAQTGGAETDQVTEAAESAGIPVLSFSETLPDGKTYLQWMQDNADALAGAFS
ncbi:metal ABC transporter solute-binding protein, Zn/Mn family [Microbacterium tumbae]